METYPPHGQQPHSAKRRRYRVPRSCDRCRTSKIKCVFEDGQCTACVNLGVPCTFANPGSLRERPPTRKDVDHLQARIRSLERLIYAIDPSYDLSNLPDPPESHLSTLRIGSQRQSTSSLTLTENLHPSHNSIHPHSSTPTAPVQVTSSVSSLTTIFNPTRFQLQNSTTNLLPSLSKLEDLSPVDRIIRHEYQKMSYSCPDYYPPPDLQQSLLEIYFREVHPIMRVIHPASFIKDFKAGRVETDESFKALCLTIFSIASRFSKDPRVYLDLEGSSNASLHTAGLRYCVAAGFYLLRPIPAPATLYELQALSLLVIYSLGAVSPDLIWCMLGVALHRSQVAGAHIEDSSRWSNSPIDDHYRRKAFFLLYECDSSVSATLGKPAYMQESDFDVLPADPGFDLELEVCVNPFLNQAGTENQTDLTVDEISQAYNMMKSSLGGLKNLLPVINLMNAQRDLHPDVKFSSCVKALIKQLDDSMNTCFEKIALKINLHHPNPDMTSDSALISSVNVTSWYHEFRLLLHQILFNSKEKGPSNQPKMPEDKQQARVPGSSTTVKKSRNPYLDICVESARAILSSINRLHQRNLLPYGFFWIPLRLKNALVILICSFFKQRKSLSEEEREARCLDISLGIQILNTLAPSTYLAGKCSNMMVNLYRSAVQHNLQQATKAGSSSTFSPSSSLSTPPAPLGVESKTNSFPGPSPEPGTADTDQPQIYSTVSSSAHTSTTTSTTFSTADNNQTLNVDPERGWRADPLLTTSNAAFPNPISNQLPSAPSDSDNANLNLLNFWPSSSPPDFPFHSST